MTFEISPTLIIIIITVALSVMAFKDKVFEKEFIFHPVTIRGGEYYRFITYGFIHADPTHLAFNMITLYFFGESMGSFYGHYFGGFGFYVFYLGGIIVSIIPSYIKNRDNIAYASLGASGAVSAVLFAFILFAPWAKLGIFFIIPMPAILFAVLYTGYSMYASKNIDDNINHSAHLWGGAYGIIVSVMLEPDLLQAFWIRLLNP